MKLFDRLRSRLVVKIGLATLAVIGVGFSIATFLNARSQERLFEDVNADAARMFTESTIAGVRSAMLTGDPIAVRGLIEDVRHRLPGREVRVYDRRGFEVFAPLGPPPRPEKIPRGLRRALGGDVVRGEVSHVPIPHEDRCRRCHEVAPVRGVLSLGPRPARGAAPSKADLDVEAVLVGLAFEQIMAAKRSEELTPFFDELSDATGRRLHVAVVNVAGEVQFGAMPLAGLPEHEVAVPEAFLDGLIARDLATKAFEDEGIDLRFVPLANEPRCHECHEPETGPMRGALVVAVRRLAGDDLVETTLDRTLRSIMLSGLGRLVIDYLESARTAAHLETLSLHDSAGRLYHDAGSRAHPPAAVQAALRGHVPAPAYIGSGALQRHVAVQKLANDRECVRCHGTDHEIRGVVEIVSPTGKEAQALRAQIRFGTSLGAATILVVFGFLWFATKRIVVDPVQHIGDIAEAVGQGRLDREAAVGSPDEIGRLGLRINDMIRGLRERTQLRKFVSGGTLAAVQGGKDVCLGGERRRVTVLFSDIRGFTAYSERTEPEKVVSMLNEYLRVQTDLVRTHGGDVDKYVGDELVAVFPNPTAAIRCALDAVDAVEALAKKDGQGIGIGIGINTGDVIVGAIGHEDRMDFTVIGDAVNVGARLCSAAPRAKVLVSSVSRQEAGADASDLAFDETAPLSVKGKAEPLRVFTARRPSK